MNYKKEILVFKLKTTKRITLYINQLTALTGALVKEDVITNRTSKKRKF